MKFSVGLAREGAEERLASRGVSRRDFMKFCAAVAAAMGMEASFAKQVAAALTDLRRPSVVYFHFAECTGCTMAVARTVNPYIDELILDTISLDYHETLMAAAGDAAEDALHQAVTSPHGYIAVVEGAIPVKDNGIYGMVGGHPMLDMAKKYLPKAQAVIAIVATTMVEATSHHRRDQCLGMWVLRPRCRRRTSPPRPWRRRRVVREL